ncbi:MAG: HypC/HybG/HupF family hydrogenase formation chaperone [Acidimicrobiales bacterium]
MPLDDAGRAVQLDDAGRLARRLPDELASASMALARRFSTNATLWCWAPRWPQHAEHVAVEFVHPVIVGKRAFSAVAVSDADPVAALRALVEAGDVLAVVGTDSTPEIGDVLRRIPAWGAESIWIGSGRRPASGMADHLLWFDDLDDEAAFNGAFVLAYHVLWELTHVCFEHPGLLKRPPGGGSEECTDAHCITCADEGRVAEVVELAGPLSVVVRSAGGTEDVDVSLVDPVAPGDLVLVHAGVALSRLDTEQP